MNYHMIHTIAAPPAPLFLALRSAPAPYPLLGIPIIPSPALTHSLKFQAQPSIPPLNNCFQLCRRERVGTV